MYMEQLIKQHDIVNSLSLVQHFYLGIWKHFRLFQTLPAGWKTGDSKTKSCRDNTVRDRGGVAHRETGKFPGGPQRFLAWWAPFDPRVLARVPWEHPSVDFCALVNESLDDTDLEIDAVLPKKRAPKKKRMSDERCPDEVVLDEVKNYRINSFNFIMDSVGQNLKRRFLDHEQSYKDFACFDLRLQRVETVRDSFIGN